MSSRPCKPNDGFMDILLGPDSRLTTEPEHRYTTYQNGKYRPSAKVLKPRLEILEQPVEKFRFRYKSEMVGAHGSILGRTSVKNRKKSYPTVELKNYPGKAIIRCSLFSANLSESQRVPHPHRLIVRQDGKEKDDPHDILVSRELGYIAVFQGMGIIHTARKNIVSELVKKKRIRMQQMVRGHKPLSKRDEVEIREQSENIAKKINLNSVTLRFEALKEDPVTGKLEPICEAVHSDLVNNMKSALTGELKICRVDKHVCSVLGNEEVFMLVEKVGKKNIQVKFYEVDDEDNEMWSDFATFSELDVHHQYAIVFRTPPYHDLNITKHAKVFVQLFRPSDGDCSEPINFQYKPQERISVQKKRCYEPSIDKEYFVPSLNYDDFEKYGLANDTDPILTKAAIDNVCEELPPDVNSMDFKQFLNAVSDSDLFGEYCKSYLTGEKEDDDFEQICMEQNNIVIDAVVPNNDTKQKIRGKLKKKKKPAIKVTEELLVPKVELEEEVDVCNDNAWLFLNDLEAQLLPEMAVLEFKSNMNVKRRYLSPDIVASQFRRRCPDGAGPLHQAIRLKQTEYMYFLLRALKAASAMKYINDKDINKKTPLHYAILHNEREYLKFLLQSGANPNMVDREGNNAFHLASLMSANTCLKHLLDETLYTIPLKFELDQKNEAGVTALHIAVRRKDFPSVRMLVNAGSDVNEVDSHHGNTALHIAVQEANMPIIQYLVENSYVMIDKPNFSGNTPLHYACVVPGSISVEMCEYLVKNKADPMKANYIRVRHNQYMLTGPKQTENEKKNQSHKDRKHFNRKLVKDMKQSKEMQERESERYDNIPSPRSVANKGRTPKVLLPVKRPDKAKSPLFVSIPSSQSEINTEGSRSNSSDGNISENSNDIMSGLEENIQDIQLEEVIEENIQDIVVEEEVVIKEEPESSAEEDYFDPEVRGHTSVDLAAGNPELQNLFGQVKQENMLDKVKEEVKEEEEEVTQEEEVEVEVHSENDEDDEMFDSDSADLPEINFSFDTKTLNALYPILNRSENWMTICEILGYGSHIPNLKESNNPSERMFQLIALSGSKVDVTQVRNILEVLLDEEAVEVIDKMITEKLAKGEFDKET